MARQGGFTLLEIMVVLAIFAVIAGALMRNVSQTVRQTTLIQERTLAYIVAENQLNELRVVPRDDANSHHTETDRVNVFMANRSWELVLEYEVTENPDMQRVLVTVFADTDFDRPMVKLVGFIGKH